MRAGFEQAKIKIEKEHEFASLKDSIERVLGASLIEKFFSKLSGKGVRVREFEKVLEKKLIDQVDSRLRKSGQSAKALYEALTVTDQGQMREFYLTRIEQVDPELRQKYQKLYRYY